MTDRLPFDLPPERLADPPVSADRRRTIRNRSMLAAGVHPATRRPITGDGRTCGDCRHSYRVDHRDRQWWKCELHRLGPSRCASSDIRVSWPACEWIDPDPEPESTPKIPRRNT